MEKHSQKDNSKIIPFIYKIKRKSKRIYFYFFFMIFRRSLSKLHFDLRILPVSSCPKRGSWPFLEICILHPNIAQRIFRSPFSSKTSKNETNKDFVEIILQNRNKSLSLPPKTPPRLENLEEISFERTSSQKKFMLIFAKLSAIGQQRSPSFTHSIPK